MGRTQSMLRATLHADKYEDAAGLALPAETRGYLDTWKRPEELVLNNPNVPMLMLKPPPVPEGGAPTGKDAKGQRAACAHLGTCLTPSWASSWRGAQA